MLICGYAPVLYRVCIEYAKQVMSTFNHETVSINTTILLKAVIWDNVNIFAHFYGTDKPQSWYIIGASDYTLWFVHHELVLITTRIRNITYSKPLAYLSCICRIDNFQYWHVPSIDMCKWTRDECAACCIGWRMHAVGFKRLIYECSRCVLISALHS